MNYSTEFLRTGKIRLFYLLTSVRPLLNWSCVGLGVLRVASDKFTLSAQHMLFQLRVKNTIYVDSTSIPFEGRLHCEILWENGGLQQLCHCNVQVE